MSTKNQNTRAAVDRVRPRQLWILNIALLIVGLMLPTVHMLSVAAKQITGDALEQNWRGAYDILVTNKDFLKRVSPGTNDLDLPFIENNYAVSAAPTLSVEQLQRIREVPQVELAAPIGYLGSQVAAEKWLGFIVPWEQLNRDTLNHFEFGITRRSHDGISLRADYTTKVQVAIDISRWDGFYSENGALARANQHGVDITYQGTPFDYGSASLIPEGIYLVLYPVALPKTSVVAVDPAAEIALTGNAQFLQPLQEAELLLSQRPELFTQTRKSGDASAVPSEFAPFPGLGDVNNAPATWGIFGKGSQLVPYLRYADGQGPQEIEVQFRRAEPNAQSAGGDTGNTGVLEYRDIGVHTVQLDEVMRPFGVFKLEVLWPGTPPSKEPMVGYTPIFKYDSVSVGGLQLTPTTDTDGHNAFTVTPNGFNPGVWERYQYDVNPPTGKLSGETAAYRRLEKTNLHIGTLNTPRVAPFEAGSFTNADLTTLGAGAPLGAYDARKAQLPGGEQLQPNRFGTGIATPPPDAIVSLNTAAQMFKGDYISAVRVRVGGVADLPRGEAQVVIDRVASQLRGLGLAAVPVGGSSQQAVNLYVPNYAFGVTDPEQQQEVRDLGWVEQSFTVTGSDQWASSTIAAVSAGVSATLLFVLLLGLAVVVVMVRPYRMREQYLLHKLGWSFTDRLRWVLAETRIGSVVFVLGVCATAVLAVVTGELLLGLVGLGVVALYLCSLPLRLRARAKPVSKLAPKRKIAALMGVETLAFAVTLLTVAVLAQVVTWLVATGARLTLPALVLQTLAPVGVVAAAVLGFMLYLQMASGTILLSILRERVRFCYVTLAQSAGSICGTLLLCAAAQIAVMAAAVWAALLLARDWFVPSEVAFIVMGAAAGAWALLLVLRVLRLRPAKMCNERNKVS